jgi:tetratricopeptide (TPR) repeat protein
MLPGGTAQVFCRLGVTHADRGEYRLAIAAYNRAIQLKPDYISAYVNRGNAYDEIGEPTGRCSITTGPSDWSLVAPGPFITGPWCMANRVTMNGPL